MDRMVEGAWDGFVRENVRFLHAQDCPKAPQRGPGFIFFGSELCRAAGNIGDNTDG